MSKKGFTVDDTVYVDITEDVNKCSVYNSCVYGTHNGNIIRFANQGHYVENVNEYGVPVGGLGLWYNEHAHVERFTKEGKFVEDKKLTQEFLQSSIVCKKNGLEADDMVSNGISYFHEKSDFFYSNFVDYQDGSNPKKRLGKAPVKGVLKGFEAFKVKCKKEKANDKPKVNLHVSNTSKNNKENEMNI